MIGPALCRIVAVMFAFLMAALAGFATLFIAGSYWAVREANVHTLSHYTDEGIAAVTFMLLVAPVLTLVPAVVAVVVGELARIRSPLYYVVAGGAAVVVMPLIAAAPEVHGGAYSAPYFSIIATAGFAGGLVYWLIAGRRA